MASHSVGLLPVHVWSGVPVYGKWCPHCLLSSGFEAKLYAVTILGVRLIGIGRRCHDCGRIITGESNDD